MELQTKKKSGSVSIAINGEMTIYAVADFKKRFIEDTSECADIEIDLSKVARLDTAGFQMLLSARRMAENGGKSIRFIDPSPDVLHLFFMYHEKIDDWSVYGRREKT